MPQTGHQFEGLLSTGGALYPTESVREIRALSDVYWGLNGRLVAALRLFPGYLAAFVAYGRLAMRDPHNDYPDWAARVCRSDTKRFLEAFHMMSKRDQHYIARHVIQPRGCTQIAVVAQ
jgi:hypothetical protein